LTISLAIAAAQSGRRVYFGTLADLITSLEEAQAPVDCRRASRCSRIRRSSWSTGSAISRSAGLAPCSFFTGARGARPLSRHRESSQRSPLLIRGTSERRSPDCQLILSSLSIASVPMHVTWSCWTSSAQSNFAARRVHSSERQMFAAELTEAPHSRRVVAKCSQPLGSRGHPWAIRCHSPAVEDAGCSIGYTST
jgi:hypothetical protein